MRSSVLADDVRTRRERLVEALRAEGLVAAVFASEGNFQFFSGYRSPSWLNRARPIFLVVAADGRCYATLNEAEAEQVALDGVDVEAAPYREPAPALLGEQVELDFMSAGASRVCALIEEEIGPGPVGFELRSSFAPGLTPAALDLIRERLGARVVDLAPIIWPIRSIKDSYAIDCLRRSGDALGRAFENFAQVARSGMTERDLHAAFMSAATEAGCDHIAGVPALSAGVRGSILKPPTDRTWDPGELLLLDCCLIVDGYWSDFCRVFAADTPSQEQLAAYDLLVDSLDAGREAVRPGAAAADVAAAIGAHLPGAAYGRFGHGIGVDLVEIPSIHPDDPTPLAPGMTICVEPNAEFAGVGTLIAEEMMVVTDNGAELLSPPFPRSIPVLA